MQYFTTESSSLTHLWFFSSSVYAVSKKCLWGSQKLELCGRGHDITDIQLKKTSIIWKLVLLCYDRPWISTKDIVTLYKKNINESQRWIIKEKKITVWFVMRNGH